MSRGKYLLIIFITVFVSHIIAVQKGSNTAPSIQPFFSFPAKDSAKLPPNNNEMLAFGYFKSGFGLQDAKATATFASAYPVSGPIDMKGGQLWLSTDLILDNPAAIISSGFFNGNHHIIDCSESISSFPASFPTTLSNANLFFKSDLTISGSVIIRGNCTLWGRFNNLNFGANGNIQVSKNATLTLKNLTLQDAGSQDIRCLDNSGKIVLDNVNWVPNSDIDFALGSILFDDQVKLIGPHSFHYSSRITSTINRGTTLSILGMKEFLIGRAVGRSSQDPLHFMDSTSKLLLDNSTLHITSSGLRLINGEVVIGGQTQFTVDAQNKANALQFGNGLVGHDTVVSALPGSILSFVKGAIAYNNTSDSSFFSNLVSKGFTVQSPTTFFFAHNLTFNFVNLIISPLAQFFYDPGVFVFFNNTTVNDSFGVYNITAKTQQEAGYFFGDNDLFTMQNGFFVQPLFVDGAGVSVNGVGDILAPIILENPESTLSLNLLGSVDENIYLDDNTLIAGHDIRMGNGQVIIGQGTVVLQDNDFSIDVDETVWTSTITFDGDDGSVTLRRDMILTSELTFSGKCIIQGNGNILYLAGAGSIKVERGSSLTIDDLHIRNMHDTNISCNDDAATLEFDDCFLRLIDDFQFNTGTLLVRHQNILSGDGFTFAFQTQMASTIQGGSVLNFSNNMRFLYNPPISSGDLLLFENETSGLIFNNLDTFEIAAGIDLQLRNGFMQVNGNLNVITDGLIFGDNVNETNDMLVNIAPGAVMDLTSGVLTYQNLDQNNWQMTDGNSTLKLENGTTLIVNRTLNLHNGQLLRSTGANVQQNDGATIIGTQNFF